MPLSNAERQLRARQRNREVRHLQRLSQWVSESAYLALGRLAQIQGRTRSKVLEGLIMKEAKAVLDQEPLQ